MSNSTGPTEGSFTLPSGTTIFWKKNEVGGRTYTSDEVGGGVHVWDTALVSVNTLLAVIQAECSLNNWEAVNGRQVPGYCPADDGAEDEEDSAGDDPRLPPALDPLYPDF